MLPCHFLVLNHYVILFLDSWNKIYSISKKEVHEKYTFLIVIRTLLSERFYANVDMNFNTDLSSILKSKHSYVLERKGSLRIKRGKGI